MDGYDLFTCVSFTNQTKSKQMKNESLPITGHIDISLHSVNEPLNTSETVNWVAALLYLTLFKNLTLGIDYYRLVTFLEHLNGV